MTSYQHLNTWFERHYELNMWETVLWHLGGLVLLAAQIAVLFSIP
jgi:hypothetical protein